MPNWCDIELRIYGKKEDLKFFESKVKTGNKPLDEQKIVPFDEEYEKTEDKVEWQYKHWGTKWGICDGQQIERKNCLYYSFQCPWSIPDILFEKMAQMFPNLTFKFKAFEAGMAFKLKGLYKDGRRIFIDQKEYRGGRGG